MNTSMKIRLLTDEYLKAIGHRMRVVRTLLKMNQKELAREMNTSPAQISKIETGLAPPNLYHLKRLKELSDKDEYLKENLSWEWLMEGKGKGIIG